MNTSENILQKDIFVPKIFCKRNLVATGLKPVGSVLHVVLYEYVGPWSALPWFAGHLEAQQCLF